MTNPKVTVLMPVYNGEKHLEEAIKSILNQTFTDFEFLIVNDGSIDNSREIIMSFNDPRIRPMDNLINVGLTKSLNLGLDLAQGKLIARQDADDISHPTRLERQVQFLDTHPEVMLLGTSARSIDERGWPIDFSWEAPTNHLAIRWYLMFENAFMHTSVMFHRNVIWKKLGGYDEASFLFEDYELWSRVAQTFLVENLPDLLIDYRHHDGSVTSLSPPPIGHLVKVVHNNLRIFSELSSVPDKWASFITRFRTRFRHHYEFKQHNDWEGVPEIYEQIWARYCQLYPEAEFNQIIRSHLSGYLYAIAYCSAPYNRRASFRAYAIAKKLARKSDNLPSLFKYMALWSFGESVWRIYHHLIQWIGRLKTSTTHI